MIETRRITALLQDIDEGRPGAADALMELVHADLERVARSHMHKRFGEGMHRLTLEPAGLVNESFLRMLRQRHGYENREQFYAIATRIMLRVLVDYCRERSAAKRGGGRSRVSISFLDEDEGGPRAAAARTTTGAIDVESLTDALDALDTLDPRKADVVRMRVIWGMQHEAVAEALGVSVPTIERDWRFARAWLAERILSGGAAQA